MAIFRIILKVAGWLLRQFTSGGYSPGQGLPSGWQVPNIPVITRKDEDKAKALKVENEVLREDASVNHAARAQELTEKSKVKDEKGRTTGYKFGK